MKNETIKTLYKRRSVRTFKTDNIPDEDMLEILKAANMAPSASNQQPWKFIVVRDQKIKDKLVEVTTNKLDELGNRLTLKRAIKEFVAYKNYLTFFNNAPAVIVVLTKPYESVFTILLDKYKTEEEKKEKYCVDAGQQTIGACVQNILIAAASLGYGTCYMTGPLIAHKSINKILDVALPYEACAIIPIGKPEKDFDEFSYYRDDVSKKISWL